METKGKVVSAGIISNERVCPGHYLMELESPGLAVKAVPGQFVNVLVSEELTDPFLRIPLGVHRITKKGISLFYKVVGTATRMLSGKIPGEKLNVLGPLGNGFDLGKETPEDKKPSLLVAGGHGTAPLYALAEELVKRGGEVTVFIGASSKNCVTLAEEFRTAGCEVRVATDDGSSGIKGFVTCAVNEFLEKELGGKTPEIYACGPEPMLAALARVTAQKGLRAQVSMDPYMACGTGVCRGCAVRTVTGLRLACKDGPVFYSDEIIWEKKEGCSP